MSIWKLSKVWKLSKYIDSQQKMLSFRYFLSTMITKAQNLWVIKSSKSFEKSRSRDSISGWFLVRKPSRPQNVKNWNLTRGNFLAKLDYSTNEFKCIAVQFKWIQNLDWFKEVLESLNYFEGGFYNKKKSGCYIRDQISELSVDYR